MIDHGKTERRAEAYASKTSEYIGWQVNKYLVEVCVPTMNPLRFEMVILQLFGLAQRQLRGRGCRGGDDAGAEPAATVEALIHRFFAERLALLDQLGDVAQIAHVGPLLSDDERARRMTDRAPIALLERQHPDEVTCTNVESSAIHGFIGAREDKFEGYSALHCTQLL